MPFYSNFIQYVLEAGYSDIILQKDSPCLFSFEHSLVETNACEGGGGAQHPMRSMRSQSGGKHDHCGDSTGRQNMAIRGR